MTTVVLAEGLVAPSVIINQDGSVTLRVESGSQGPKGDDGWAVDVETVNAAGPNLVLDYAAGKHKRINLLGNITSVTITGWPQAGQLARLSLQLYNSGAFNIANTAWGPSVWWIGGPPSLTSGAGKRDFLALTTIDGGSEVWGHTVGQNWVQSAP